MLSTYQNLSHFLNYRTSNLGMITLTNDILKNRDIFSYISPSGIVLNDNLDDLNKISSNDGNYDKEDIIMKTLIFNNTIYDDSNKVNNIIKYILNTEKNYNIGDFSDNITLNASFYENNLVKHNDIDKDVMCSTLPTTNCDDIIDIDLSYYASQIAIKIMFILDVLEQIYYNISINKDNRENIINNLRNLTIRSRYYIEKGEWKLYNIKNIDGVSTSYYNITFTDKLFPQERDPTTGKLLENQKTELFIANISSVDSSLSNIITNQTVMEQITLFKDVILKHINYIKIADMMYSDNFSKFYKLCRLMLNTNILNSISILVKNVVNSNTDTTTSYPYNITNKQDITFPFYYDYNLPQSNIENETLYINSLKIATGNLNITQSTPFKSLKILSNGIITKNEDAKTENDLKNILSIDETKDTEVKIIGTIYDTDKYITPAGAVFNYVAKTTPSVTPSNTKLVLTINDNNILSNISGLEKNKKYYIKLYNFSCANSEDLSILDNVKNINIYWKNSTKTLFIDAIDISGSYNIDVATYKIYNISLTTSLVLTIPSSLKTNSQSGNISIFIPNTTIKPILTNTTTTTTVESTTFTNNLLNIPLTDVSATTYTIAKDPPTSTDTINTKYFYNELSFIPHYLSFKYINGSDVFNYIWQYNNLPANSANKFINEFTISNPNNPFISPISYENSAYLTNTENYYKDDNSKYYGLNNIENKLLNKIIDNLTFTIAGNFIQDTKDNDAIIKSMSNLADINKKLAKNSNIIKKNNNESISEQSKVLSSGALFISCVIILVIIIFAAVYLPISNISRTNAISISGVLFIIAIIMYVIMKILEGYKYNSYEESFINYSSYNDKINNIIKALLNNLYNERTRISQQVVKPSIQKEEYYFKEKSKKFEIYKGRTYSDLQIITRIRQKNIAKIDCMLEISIIVSLALLLYILKPTWLNIILGVSIILILISIFIMFVRLTNVVQTNAKNKYWTRPDTSLDKLKYSTTPLS